MYSLHEPWRILSEFLLVPLVLMIITAGIFSQGKGQDPALMDTSRKGADYN